MSGKIEKAEKSAKLPRDRSKGPKDKDSPPELNLDSLKGDSESSKSISPRGGKKKRTEITAPAAVRFETQEDRFVAREKIASRSSSAGPTSGVDPRPKGEVEDAEALMQLFRDFVGQMTPSLNNVVRRNQELKSQVTSMLKAAQVEEAPFMALARDKESLAREYDTLRYEHQLLQQELEQLKRDNALLIVENQQLQSDNRRLRRKSSLISSSSSTAVDSSSNGAANGASVASTAAGAGAGGSNSTQTTPAKLKRKDNVAELEQSILDLEEEIRSPRGLLAGSSASASPELSRPEAITRDAGRPEIPPRESTPTKSSKRKMTKSLSSDPQNAQTIVSSTPGMSPSPSASAAISASYSSATAAGTNGTTPTRAKAPPERVVSAPSEVKSTIHSQGSFHATPSTSTPGSPSVVHNIVRQEARLVQNVGSYPSSPHTAAAATPASTAAAAAAGQRPFTAEDREEQRLAKYLGGGGGGASGGGRRSSPNMITKSQLTGSRGSLVLTIAETAAFSQLFRKWDTGSNDQIERHELELVFEQMATNDVLKTLYQTTASTVSKINWDSLGIAKSTPITLSSALSFLTDCKAGIAQPSVLVNKS